MTIVRTTSLRFGLLFLALGAGCGHSARSPSFDNASSGGGGEDAGTIPSFFDDDGGIHACPAGADPSSSIGCEYYAVHMDGTFDADNGCFVVFLANASNQQAHLEATFDGTTLDVSTYAKIPKGRGLNLTYDPFDPYQGLDPGQVAILFLAGPAQPGKPTPYDQGDPVPCPVAPALSSLTQLHGTGIGRAFRIRTDVPVAAYQMLPYGGGSAAVTGATLLMPSASFDTNYLAVNAYRNDGSQSNGDTLHGASLDIVAAEDATSITLLPNVEVLPGQNVPGGPAGQPMTVTLNAGQTLQITQSLEITGSPIQSDKPIGLFGGFQCLALGGQCCCDHTEQQIPPVHAMGSAYLGVGYRPRTQFPENRLWRVIGAVDGTALSYDPPVVGAPTSLNHSDVQEFHTDTPFAVTSQDAQHPFLLLSYMGSANDLGTASDSQGYGDPDLVRVVPVPQYRTDYIFFTDPTYPETNLVVTRGRGKDGAFKDVTLDCAGTLGAWAPVDSRDQYEFTRVDLVRHDFQPQGSCDNGRHEMTSTAPFGLTVWAWGTPETSVETGYVSYGYPAGENLLPINSVVVPPR